MERQDVGGRSLVGEERQLAEDVLTKAGELLDMDGASGTSKRYDGPDKIAEYYVLQLPTQIGEKDTTVPFEAKAPSWPKLTIHRQYQADGATPLSTEISIDVRRNNRVLKTFSLRYFGPHPDYKYSSPPRSFARLAEKRVLKDFLTILSGDSIYYIGQS